jgi:hypothetical protein
MMPREVVGRIEDSPVDPHVRIFVAAKMTYGSGASSPAPAPSMFSGSLTS